MQIHVQLFSILRDCLPAGSERGQATVNLPEGATLADLVSRLGIDRHLGCNAAELTATASWQVLVSGQFAKPTQGGPQSATGPWSSGSEMDSRGQQA
jgi:hypothetical protein